MALLIQLPPEILHNILSFVEPRDLVEASRACRYLYGFTKGNRALARDVYYRTLDAPPRSDLDWEKELRDLVWLQRICANVSAEDMNHEQLLSFVYTTVARLLQNASHSPSASSPPARATQTRTYPPSRNAALLGSLFASNATREAFLNRSFLCERARGGSEARPLPNPPRRLHQQSAKLHSLYGAVGQHQHQQHQRVAHRTRSATSAAASSATHLYPFACSKVYDMREYTPGSMWGPFMADGTGRADWEKVEAILVVLRTNIGNKGLDKFDVFGSLWNAPFAGSWAGNYNDFDNYNFPIGQGRLPANMPRPALDVGEATRLILMKIAVTKIEYPIDDENDTQQQHPIVHFSGFSRSFDGSWDENANSDLRGTASMTAEGEVRWTTFSIFNGEDRWRSEGIQLGGVRSARGVVGNWFDNGYDPHGPCGPTAFWKVSDNEPNKDGDHRGLLHGFLPTVQYGYNDEIYIDDEDFSDVEFVDVITHGHYHGFDSDNDG
ncbi:hypothetical protein B0T19DRAFT_464085 [Cercophora scortea]|uniref:F-box domain-containing protein n=1 Tax=Cercophora scortea TaxID=314031 RepID=A0AAE0IFD9_9PEZI|nr:hypothetical protein B0T19DRAFT_464085 [Cercophora scortea]